MARALSRRTRTLGPGVGSVLEVLVRCGQRATDDVGGRLADEVRIVDRYGEPGGSKLDKKGAP